METCARRHKHKSPALYPALAAIVLALVACHPTWETTVVAPDESLYVVNRGTIADLSDYIERDEGQEGVPLERVLWNAGHTLVERVTLVQADGTRQVLDWRASGASVAGRDVEWHENGELAYDGRSGTVARIEVQPPALASKVQASITDLAPTAAAALGLPAPAQATGRALDVPPAEQVLLLFLDGLGYLRYRRALEQGDVPVLSGLDAPLVATTTYPPATTTSTGSLLTGAPPAVHGADRRGMRKTEVETLFDVTTASGRRVIAVEGEALAFQLRNAEWQLSGDRDGNGSTDDNVLHNALAALEHGMPDLLLVHFHGIDDAGHTYGPGAPEERAALREVDAAVGEILNALPTKTLVLIFADHGMHPVQEEGRLGNHGHLIAEDMLIPLFVWFQ